MGLFDDLNQLKRKPSDRNSLDFIFNKQPLGKQRDGNSINYLNTKGGEFRIKIGGIYTGPYHIHYEKGPMVGSYHKNTEHEVLIPINEDAANIIRDHLGYNPYQNNEYENFQKENTNNGGGSY